MGLRMLIIPVLFSAVLHAGSGCFAAEPVSLFPAREMGLPDPADTTAGKEDEPNWSPEYIKDLLTKETGEPDIEGSTWKRKKNPGTAMLCALVFPGLGQIYNERPLKAAIAMGVETYYIMNIIHNYRIAGDWRDERDALDQNIPCGDHTCLNPAWKNANAWYKEYRARTVDWIWWTSGIVLIVVLDAYVDAHLHDMRFHVEASRSGEATRFAVVVDF